MAREDRPLARSARPVCALEHFVKTSDLAVFVCPESHSPLRLEVIESDGDNVIEGWLVAPSEVRYRIAKGVPDFSPQGRKGQELEKTRQMFDALASGYDEFHHLNYSPFPADEATTRKGVIDRLKLHSGAMVLEVNAGTGRDTRLIAERLGTEGVLHAQDISGGMLEQCKAALLGTRCTFSMHIGDACGLPYRDNTFDCSFSYGGISLAAYADVRAALAELTRVVKVGGKVVFGAPGVGPWLAQTYFSNVLINHKKVYAEPAPIAALPVCARDVQVTWILSGAAYVVEYTVGEGEPGADFDFAIPGERGGTLRTRFEGQLDGVSPETKALAWKAVRHSGQDMHTWLDTVVGAAAKKTLGRE
jgi:ubiquinone/menaquinone biosynthesis C-methylase UbiE